MRLAAYASVVLPAGLALFVLARRIEDRDRRWILIFLGAEFFVFMLLYVFNGITALHFARYSIPIWPMGIIAATYGLYRLSLNGQRWAVAAAAIAFLGMAAYETMVRSDFPRDTLVRAMALPDVPLKSGAYLERYRQPRMRPVVIATQEVQVRMQLDDRFVIRSLDGILDAVYLNYLCHGYNDHDGYFIDQKVDFLETPFANYNHDRSRWSLNRLSTLPVGQSIERPGIRYTKLADDTVKVTRLVARSQDRAIQPCKLDSSSPYW